MKRILVIGLLALTMFSFKYVEESNFLIGKWEWKKVYKEGPLTIMVLFRADGTYDGFANKKSFVSGTYKLKTDTLYITDPICNSKYEGVYKITKFGEQDSIKFDVIIDTCKVRVEGVNGFTYKRIKANK